MPQTAVYTGDANGPKVYRVGRIGFDSGNQDISANAYEAQMKTERFTPLGEGGLMHFRRVVIRILRNADWQMTVTVFVDEDQTQVYDDSVSTSPQTDQSVVISGTASGFGEENVEISIDDVGTSIQVQVDITSTDINGVLLFESMYVHGRPIKASESGDEAESE